jgi:parallel beta helix pectate lyase-like protein
MHLRNLRLKIIEYFLRWRAAAAIAGLMLAGYASPAHALPSCLSPISSCGCSIDSAAVFETSGALVSADPSTDCIDIAASGAVLVLAGNITGPGAGVTADGIHIMSSAAGVFISGTTTPLFKLLHAVVGGFAMGIQVDGANAEINQLDATGNVTNGVVFNNVTDSDYAESSAKSNAGGDGILINGGSSNLVVDALIDMNNYGIEISGSSNNRIVDSEGNSNKVYGLWFAQSNGNHIKDSSTDSNTGTGTYLGCFATGGPSGKKCPAGMKPSKFNRVISSGGNKNGGAGLAVDLSDSSNLLDENGGSSNTTDDAVDKNRKCDHNIWMENGFTTVSQSCIH